MRNSFNVWSSQAPPIEQEKQVTCYNCKCTCGYFDSGLSKHVSSDGRYERDWIVCANCGEQCTIRFWSAQEELLQRQREEGEREVQRVNAEIKGRFARMDPRLREELEYENFVASVLA